MIHPRFAARSDADLRRLVDHAPAGWLVGAQPGQAIWMPWQAQWSADGQLLAFDSHVGRRHPIVQTLRAQPEATLLLVAVHGYVSPAWMRDRTQAPTWNSARLSCAVRVQLLDDGAWLAAHLRALSAGHEAASALRPPQPAAPWEVHEMGARYDALAARLLGLRAQLLSHEAVFKLGQDERDDVYADIEPAVRARDPALAGWMRDFNPGRATGPTPDPQPD